MRFHLNWTVRNGMKVWQAKILRRLIRKTLAVVMVIVKRKMKSAIVVTHLCVGMRDLLVTLVVDVTVNATVTRAAIVIPTVTVTRVATAIGEIVVWSLKREQHPHLVTAAVALALALEPFCVEDHREIHFEDALMKQLHEQRVAVTVETEIVIAAEVIAIVNKLTVFGKIATGNEVSVIEKIAIAAAIVTIPVMVTVNVIVRESKNDLVIARGHP